MEWTPGKGREAHAESSKVPEDAPVIVTVCRLFPPKDQASWSVPCPHCDRSTPTCRLVVVGQEMIVGYQKQLKELAHELGVTTI